MQPLRSSGPARCSDTFTVLVGTILESVYNCVHLADKKPNPSEVRGASLFPRHTRDSPEVHVCPDGPASSAHSPHRDPLCPSTWAAGGPRPVPPRELQVVHALSPPPGSCRGSTWWPQLSIQLPSPCEGHCAETFPSTGGDLAGGRLEGRLLPGTQPQGPENHDGSGRRA